jgi:hypothetical protein
MRISVDERDAGYPEYKNSVHQGKTVRVFLDGLEQKQVITADSCDGFIVAIELDERGNFVWDRKTGVIAEKRLCGQVDIRIE